MKAQRPKVFLFIVGWPTGGRQICYLPCGDSAKGLASSGADVKTTVLIETCSAV